MKYTEKNKLQYFEKKITEKKTKKWCETFDLQQLQNSNPAEFKIL